MCNIDKHDRETNLIIDSTVTCNIHLDWLFYYMTDSDIAAPHHLSNQHLPPRPHSLCMKTEVNAFKPF
jgi:hypothetical protein